MTMRKRNLLLCVGWLAATVAAPWLCAQNSTQPSKGNGAPVADRFVSTPGQMVSGPGQMVTGPGQMVISPGVMVAGPGQSISPAPGVIGPFDSQGEQTLVQAPEPQWGQQAVRPGRRHHQRHDYRPEYGVVEGYAAPYLVNESSSGAGSSAGSGTATGTGSGARSMIGVSGVATDSATDEAESYADAPSGNRPAYRPEPESEVPSTAPNVIQSKEPVLVIVMKDGKQRKVRNYALTPQVLIDLDGAANGKDVEIPLNAINLMATQKAAAQAGLSFSVPTS
ncbi:MAG: hypothetical protein ACP5M4_05060 [Acidobacteriaceae bacterium]